MNASSPGRGSGGQRPPEAKAFLSQSVPHGCKIAGCGRHAGKLRLAGWPCRQIEPSLQMTMPADLFYFFFSMYPLFSVAIISGRACA